MEAEPAIAGILGLELTASMSFEVMGALGSNFPFCSPGADVFAEVCTSGDSDGCGAEIGATKVGSAGGAGITAHAGVAGGEFDFTGGVNCKKK